MNKQTRKERYQSFCEKTFVPIYSKSWWMDAVCGEDNWNVWLYENGNDVLAAMPYYMEERNGYRYITKAPLTQNNGIIFRHAENAGLIARQAFEEKVINAACDYIRSTGVDVYEQQYQTTFNNWLPFFWNRYTAITRYTCMMEDTSDPDVMWNNINSNRRKKIRKGQRETELRFDMSPKRFYEENEKTYKKQGLRTPFSFALWERLEHACRTHDASRIMYRVSSDGSVASISFVVWDDSRVYKLIGGGVPELSHLEAYSAIVWDEFMLAHEQNKILDFEGSVIKRIAKANREYGAVPVPYFRIRKVFNPAIIRQEAEEMITQNMMGGGYRLVTFMTLPKRSVA